RPADAGSRGQRQLLPDRDLQQPHRGGPRHPRGSPRQGRVLAGHRTQHPRRTAATVRPGNPVLPGQSRRRRLAERHRRLDAAQGQLLAGDPVSADCHKALVTIEIPACDPCTGTGPGDGPGAEGPPQPVPTPFLVIPCAPGDPGTRPIPAAQALYSQAIGWTIVNPAAPGGWNDFQVQLSCAVANLGDVASPAAMIEFYTGAAINVRHKGHAALTPAEVKAGV